MGSVAGPCLCWCLCPHALAIATALHIVVACPPDAASARRWARRRFPATPRWRTFSTTPCSRRTTRQPGCVAALVGSRALLPPAATAAFAPACAAAAVAALPLLPLQLARATLLTKCVPVAQTWGITRTRLGLRFPNWSLWGNLRCECCGARPPGKACIACMPGGVGNFNRPS